MKMKGDNVFKLLVHFLEYSKHSETLANINSLSQTNFFPYVILFPGFENHKYVYIGQE